jgi:hypothetical protein
MIVGGLFLLVVVLTGAFVGFLLWVRAFADLLWMFIMRRAAVSAVCILVFLASAGLFAGLTDFDSLSATALMVSLFLTPLLARPLANGLCHAWAKRSELGSVGLRGLSWTSYIFDSEEAGRRERYKPPRV